jgi:hypothetical protein
VPANLVSPQAAEPIADSLSDVKQTPQSPAKRTNSTFSRQLLETHDSDSTPSRSVLSVTKSPPPALTPIHKTPSSTDKPLTTTASQVIAPRTVTTVNPQWSARRDTVANAAVDVTFDRAFKHKRAVQSIRFSLDGMYLAVAAESEQGSVIFLYNVETGVKHW